MWDRAATVDDERQHAAHRSGGSVQPTSHVANVIAQPSAMNAPMLLQGSQGIDPAKFLDRGPLAGRAHRLLGLGPVGSARLGRTMPSLINAFGGSPQTWHHVGTPWIAARSLARTPESLPSQPSVSWLLGSKR